jgi:seryl-tRNA synthetase
MYFKKYDEFVGDKLNEDKLSRTTKRIETLKKKRDRLNKKAEKTSNEKKKQSLLAEIADLDKSILEFEKRRSKRARI